MHLTARQIVAAGNCRLTMQSFSSAKYQKAFKASRPSRCQGSKLTCRAQQQQLVTTAAAAHLCIHYTNVQVETKSPGISVHDLTPAINQEISEAGVVEGWVNVLSRHTTTAVTINENETRLKDDIRQWLHKLAPPTEPYLHNDLHLREAPDNWPGGHAAWVKQEPINAHSHLLSMMLGNTLTVPITNGKLATGTWQSVLLVELDGPRSRTVGVQVVGHKAA